MNYVNIFICYFVAIISALICKVSVACRNCEKVMNHIFQFPGLQSKNMSGIYGKEMEGLFTFSFCKRSLSNAYAYAFHFFAAALIWSGL